MDLEPFRPRFPWYGRHLQTLRNPLRPAPRLPGGQGRAVRLALPDGDVLSARLDEPRRDAGERATVVLVHGLGGCETSHYVLAASAFFTGLGSAVYRLSLRGAGPSQTSCSDWSHAGRFEDLEAAFDQLEAGSDGFAAIGFSLGGCVLLNYVARGRVDPRLRAAASVCAPLDLLGASEVLHAPRNRLYHDYLLRALKKDYLNPNGKLAAADRARIEAARTLFEVDDRFTAPRHGFGRAEVYYRYASPLAHLSRIERPTLLVHAVDDPFVPAAPYRGAATEKVGVAMAAGGGHLGFHDRAGLWHLRRIEAFLRAVGAASRPDLLSAVAASC